MPAPSEYVTLENPSAAFICSAANPTLIAIEIRNDVEQKQERQQTPAGLRESGGDAWSSATIRGVAFHVPGGGAVLPRAHHAALVRLSLAVITYLDRVCISAAAPYITDELHLTTAQMARC